MKCKIKENKNARKNKKNVGGCRKYEKIYGPSRLDLGR